MLRERIDTRHLATSDGNSPPSGDGACRCDDGLADEALKRRGDRIAATASRCTAEVLREIMATRTHPR
jgi:hypothetical protein